MVSCFVIPLCVCVCFSGVWLVGKLVSAGMFVDSSGYLLLTAADPPHHRRLLLLLLLLYYYYYYYIIIIIIIIICSFLGYVGYSVFGNLGSMIVVCVGFDVSRPFV